MSKRIPLFLISVFLLSAMYGAVFTISVMAKPDIIRVPADYLTIQAAINAASPGDIVLVASGTYYEHVTVNRSLTLTGEDKATTIIDGNGTGTVITITADNVVLNGFTIQNGGTGIHLDQSNGSIISYNIVVSNVFVNGFPLHGGTGIYLDRSDGSVISGNMIISNENFGIDLSNSNDNAIIGNTLLRNRGGLPSLPMGGGIRLLRSNSNLIDGNVIGNGIFGIMLEYSGNNSIVGNSVADNQIGIMITDSSDNMIYQNNLINNLNQASIFDSYNVAWDNGTVGNYWSNYTGLDDGSGGRVAGDGVGDTDLPHLGVDSYPLINPWGPIPVIWENIEYPVAVPSNSTVSAFRFLQAEKRIVFDVTGPPGTVGYCNVTIPKALLRGDPWTILLNATDITAQATITENETHTSLYFTYTHSTYKVQIIGTWVVPEFPAAITLPLFMIITLCAVVLAKKRRRS